MKKYLFIFLLAFVPLFSSAQNGNNSTTYYFKGSLAVGKNSTAPAAASSLMEVGNGSDTKGFLFPRIADTNAISSPIEGLFAYDKSTKTLRYFNGLQWKEIGSGGGTTITPGSGLRFNGDTLNIGLDLADLTKGVLTSDLYLSKNASSAALWAITDTTVQVFMPGFEQALLITPGLTGLLNNRNKVSIQAFKLSEMISGNGGSWLSIDSTGASLYFLNSVFPNHQALHYKDNYHNHFTKSSIPDIAYCDSVYTSNDSGTVRSVSAAITNGDALATSGSPITTTGTLNFSWQGLVSDYVRGNGTLAAFPTPLSGYALTKTGNTFSVDSSIIVKQNGNSFGTTFSIGSNDASAFAVRTGGVNRFIVSSTTAQIQNATSGTYFSLNLGNNVAPAFISRNTNDAISAMIINNASATSTGKILDFQSAGTSVASVAKTGAITGLSFIKTGGLSTQYLMADGSTSLGSNFATTNLTFTGARTHDAAGNSLTINNLGATNFNSTSSINLTVTGGGPIKLESASGIKLKSTDIITGFTGTEQKVLVVDSAGFIKSSTILRVEGTPIVTCSIPGITVTLVAGKDNAGIINVNNTTGGTITGIPIVVTFGNPWTTLAVPYVHGDASETAIGTTDPSLGSPTHFTFTITNGLFAGQDLDYVYQVQGQ